MLCYSPSPSPLNNKSNLAISQYMKMTFPFPFLLLFLFCFVFFYEKHVQVKQHLGWKVVSLHSSKWRHPPPSRKITVHLTEDSITRLQMEKQAPGQLGLMIQISGFKWILEEMWELQSSLLKGVKTTISGWRHLLSHTVWMATLLFRFTRRMGLKRSGEVHFAWWSFQSNIISKFLSIKSLLKEIQSSWEFAAKI